MNILRTSLAVTLALAAPLVVTGCASSTAPTAAASATGSVAPPVTSAQSPSTPAASAPVTRATLPTTRPKPAPTVSATGTTGSGGGGGDVTNCVNPMLTVTRSTTDGAAGTLVQRFVLTNVSSAPCSMHGLPTLTPYGAMSGPVPAVHPIPSGFGDLGQNGGTVVLAPGKTAVFFLKWSDVPTSESPCPKAAGFDFRAPLDPLADGDKKVPFAFQPCGTSIEVSQVLPATVTA